MAFEGERHHAVMPAREVSLYVQEYLEYIDDDDLAIPEEDENNDNWRIGANVGEEPEDFGELALCVRELLRIPVDRDEEVQSRTKQHFFCLARFNSLHLSPDP
jgi:hypothetical protein